MRHGGQVRLVAWPVAVRVERRARLMAPARSAAEVAAAVVVAVAACAAGVLAAALVTAPPAGATAFGPGSSRVLPRPALAVQGVSVAEPTRQTTVATAIPTVTGYTVPDARVELSSDDDAPLGSTTSDQTGFWSWRPSQPFPAGAHRLFLALADATGTAGPRRLVATVVVPSSRAAQLQPVTPRPGLGGLNALTGSLAVLSGCLVLEAVYLVVRRRSGRSPRPPPGVPAEEPSAGARRGRAGTGRGGSPRARRLLIGAALAAVGVRLVFSAPLVHDWDGYVFSKSVQNLLHGESPYQTAARNSPDIYPDSDRPTTEQWYAYPPLPLLGMAAAYIVPKAASVAMTPLVTNMALKMPMIAGDLLCAWLVWLLVRRLGSARAARRAALLILFNPLLIWVSAAWGMFDIWMVDFILLFVLAVRARRPVLAGMALGAAPLVKLFPVLFVPVLVAYAWAHFTGRTERRRLVLAGVGTIGAVVLPFLVTSPRGFVNQNLLLHLIRPPQGVGIAGMIDFVTHVRDVGLPPVIPILSLASLVLAGLLVVWGARRVGGSEHRLLTVVTAVYATVLLGNKVVNEQYFVVLVALVVVLAHVPAGARPLLSVRLLAWVEVTTTSAVLLASVLLGFHFLTFIPTEIAEGRLGGSSNQLVHSLSRAFPGIPLHSYPDSLLTWYNAPQTLAYLAMVPALVLLGVLVGRVSIPVLHDLRRLPGAVRRLRPRPFSVPRGRHVALRTGVAATVVVVTSVSLPLTASSREPIVLPDRQPGVSGKGALGGPAVGTFYYLWWNNPSHQPDRPDDAWSRTSQAPTAGYYTSKNAFFVRHIRQMREAGIDFAFTSYHLYDRERFKLFGTYADNLGFHYAPMVEPDDALSGLRFRPIGPTGSPELGYRVSDDAEHQLVDTILSAAEGRVHAPGWLRIGGRPVVAVYDGHFFFPSWDAESKRALATRVVDGYRGGAADPFAAMSSAWGASVRTLDDVVARYPADNHVFSDAFTSPLERTSDRDFRRAFLASYADLWARVRAEVEAKVGPVYLLSSYPGTQRDPKDVVITADDLDNLGTFDNQLAYSLANTWTYWRDALPAENVLDVWAAQVGAQARRDTARRRLRFQTVTASYDDRAFRKDLGFVVPPRVGGEPLYDRTWDIALANRPDVVMVATWNEFFEGTGIEPSRQLGDSSLVATARWAQRFKSSASEPDPAPLPASPPAADVGATPASPSAPASVSGETDAGRPAGRAARPAVAPGRPRWHSTGRAGVIARHHPRWLPRPAAHHGGHRHLPTAPP